MGFADYVLKHPASFRRRCKEGESTVISFEPREDGLTAFDWRGVKLYVLNQSSAAGFEMLDTKGRAVFRTRCRAARRSEAVVEDSSGAVLTTLEAQNFAWHDTSYSWRPKAGFSLSGSVTFRLEAIRGPRSNPCPLAVLELPGKSSPVKLRVEAAANSLPLGLLIFMALMIDRQWSSLKGLAPLKRLTFSSKWA